MTYEHMGVDQTVHTGGRQSCAACIAMEDDGFYPPGTDDEPLPGQLIEASSLGTPAARAFRESVSDEDVDRIMGRVNEQTAATKDVEPQPGWVSLGGMRQWVPDLNKLEIVRGQGQMPPEKEVPVTEEDWVNPQHYKRGPKVSFSVGRQHQTRTLECIEVVRAVPDYRLGNAIRYIWRVAFGGKWNNREDILKAIWYLTDFLENPVKGTGNE